METRDYLDDVLSEDCVVRDATIQELKRIPYDGYLTTDWWLYVREQELAENDYCERCLETQGLQIHHTTYEIRGEELESMDRLEMLCVRCHREEHHLPIF